jgi:hypothetical protein
MEVPLFEAVDCSCWVCGADALWAIEVAGEDEAIEVVFACELHARGHIRHGIALPEHMPDVRPSGA